MAKANPAKLKEMQDPFIKEAVKYRVLPIDDRVLERLNAALVGRTSLTVYEGMTSMSENVFINTKNGSHTITAAIEIPKGGANGGGCTPRGNRTEEGAGRLSDMYPKGAALVNEWDRQ